MCVASSGFEGASGPSSASPPAEPVGGCAGVERHCLLPRGVTKWPLDGQPSDDRSGQIYPAVAETGEKCLNVRATTDSQATLVKHVWVGEFQAPGVTWRRLGAVVHNTVVNGDLDGSSSIANGSWWVIRVNWWDFWWIFVRGSLLNLWVPGLRRPGWYGGYRLAIKPSRALTAEKSPAMQENGVTTAVSM